MLFKTGCFKRCIPNRAPCGLMLWTSFGGDGRDRTDDLKLAKLPLSQLSYVPLKPSHPTKAKGFQRLCWSESRAPNLVGLGRLELPTSRLSGVRSNRTELQAPVAITRLGYASMRKRNEDGDVLLINLPFPADINASFERRVQ